MATSKTPSVQVHLVLPRLGAGSLTPREAQAILKVAFLAGEADGRVNDEEESSFRGLVKGLRALVAPGDKAMSDDALDEMLGTFGRLVDEKGRDEGVKEIARALERPLVRDVAYKVAVGMSLADMDKSDDESDFDAELMAALNITEEQAGILAGDVYAALET